MQKKQPAVRDRKRNALAGSEVGPAVGDKEVVAAAFRSVFGVSGAGASVHCEVTLLT